MAIKIQVNTRFGDYYSAAYVRILSLKINYVSNYAEVEMGTYKDEASRKLGKDPVLVESIRMVGDKFKEFFKELSLDKIDAKISPIADIYNFLTMEEGGKYEGGLKLYDEIVKEDGEVKEVGKEEVIEEERKVKDAAN